MYAKATAVADVNTRKDGIELVLELFEMAQEEYSEELDFEDALHDATELSSGFDQMVRMVENQGIETSELATTFEEILSEWDVDDFEQFMKGANEQGGEIDRTINQSMGIFFPWQTTSPTLRTKNYRPSETQSYLEQRLAEGLGVRGGVPTPSKARSALLCRCHERCRTQRRR